MENMDEEKIEEIIERKVEEKLEEKIDGQESTPEPGNWIDQKITEKFNQHQRKEAEEDESGISRRSFLKALGIGAGGLALTSTVSSASLLSSTTIGGNDPLTTADEGHNNGINADTVDGKHSDDLTTPTYTLEEGSGTFTVSAYSTKTYEVSFNNNYKEGSVSVGGLLQSDDYTEAVTPSFRGYIKDVDGNITGVKIIAACDYGTSMTYEYNYAFYGIIA